jgi:Arylsulfotransferase (ASST)
VVVGCVVVVGLLSVVASARAAVSVYPLPGSRYETPATQIVFRNVAPGRIGAVTVVGSVSGVDVGRIVADADGQGGSFLPAKPFRAGETVTVTTSLPLVGVSGGRFSFSIASVASFRAPPPLPRAAAGADGLQHFRSRPDLVPASVTVAVNHAPVADGDWFLAPQFGPSQDGPMILDPRGRLVWFKPTPIASKLMTMDFRVQRLFGAPVLSWWQGYSSSGSGIGSGYIYDAAYRQQYVVHAGDGLSMDAHEFLITNAGQAWVIAVSPVHLPGVSRVVYDATVQEIEIKTGLVLFEWHALDHINLAESYHYGPHVGGYVLDPYHLNSVALDRDGNPVISARDTSAIYKIDRASGQILWRLGGKRSSFKMGPGTSTAFQHDAIVQPDGSLTVFDDGAGPPKLHPFSRGATISLDFTKMTARLVREYDHAPQLLADFEGSMQTLGDGEVILGWGQQPYFSEASANGTQDFDARFTSSTASYRAYRFNWSAQPPTAPALAISPHPDGSIGMYLSWNGATTVSSWRILSGADSSSLHAVGTAPVNGFETAVTVHSGNPSFAAQALGSGGQLLGSTRTLGAAQRIAIYGHSAFVSSASGLAGIPVSCFAAKPCQVVISVDAGRTLVARSGSQTLAPNQTGLLFFRLSRSAQATLNHNHRLNVSLTARSLTGLNSTVNITLIGFTISGAGPHRSSTHTTSGIGLLGLTAFTRATNGVGGLLTSCTSPTPCTASTKLTVANTVIAQTGPEFLGGNQAGYLTFTLNTTGKTLLAKAPGHQLAAHATITGSTNTSGDIALVPIS